MARKEGGPKKGAASLIDYFKDRHGQLDALTLLPPAELAAIMNHIAKNPAAWFALVKYAKVRTRIARDMKPEDIEDALNLIDVQKVMES